MKTLNYINKLKNSNNNPERVYLQNEKEKNTMIMQNIHQTSRRSFNFNVFDSIPFNKNIITILDDTNKLRDKIKSPAKKKVDNEIFDLKMDKNNKKNDKNIYDSSKEIDLSSKGYNNLQQETKEDQEESTQFFQTQGYYREIISEKAKVENILRKEIIEIAEKLYIKKLDKANANEDLSYSLIKMSKINEELRIIRDQYEISSKELTNTINNFQIDNKITFTPESKKKGVTNSKTYKKPISQKMSLRETIPKSNLQIFNFINNEDEIDKKKQELKKKRYALDDNFRSHQSKLEENKFIVSNEISAKKKVVNKFEIEIRLLKNHFASLSKDQRMYYLDILINGLDVR